MLYLAYVQSNESLFMLNPVGSVSIDSVPWYFKSRKWPMKVSVLQVVVYDVLSVGR